MADDGMSPVPLSPYSSFLRDLRERLNVKEIHRALREQYERAGYLAGKQDEGHVVTSMGITRDISLSREEIDKLQKELDKINGTVATLYSVPDVITGGTAATMRMSVSGSNYYYSAIPGKQKALAAAQQVAPETRKIPPGVHFAPARRIGDEVRNRYLDHLADMLSRGFIDAAEYDARLAQMMKAKTREDLDFLVKDLPMLPLPVVAASSPRRHFPFASCAFGMSASAIIYVAVMLGTGLIAAAAAFWLFLFLTVITILLAFCLRHGG
jgi:hypothetical protein